MKHIRSSFFGLILTGIVASIALLIEAQLPVAQDIHFLLQFVWLGVVGAALFLFAIQPALNQPLILRSAPIESLNDEPQTEVSEWFDQDRAWLQTHPDSNWAEPNAKE